MAGFNIDTFRAQGLQLGGARPSQFEVNMFFPFQAGTAQRFRFMCRAASIPPAQIDEVPVMYFGRAVKYAGDRSFPDWVVTVMNDEDYSLRLLFENWSNRINTLVSNRMDSSVYPTGYKVQAEVTQYGKAGDAIRAYTFDGLWPKLVDSMPLDWAATNQIQEFNVTLAYDLWKPATTGLGASEGDYSPVLSDDGQS